MVLFIVFVIALRAYTVLRVSMTSLIKIVLLPFRLLLHRPLIKLNRLKQTTPIFQTRLHPAILRMNWMHLTA